MIVITKGGERMLSIVTSLYSFAKSAQYGFRMCGDWYKAGSD